MMDLLIDWLYFLCSHAANFGHLPTDLKPIGADESGFHWEARCVLCGKIYEVTTDLLRDGEQR